MLGRRCRDFRVAFAKSNGAARAIRSCRSNQNSRVEDKRANFNAEIVFLRAEENVRPIAAAIIALLHLGV